MPLAFFIVATFALLARAVERESQPAWWILAGLAAGLAAWTKNEGLLFAGALAVAAAMSAILKCSVFPSFKSVAWFAAGMAPCVLAVVELKTAWALPNRFLAAQSLAHLSGRLTEFEGLQTITASMAGELWHSGAALVGPLPLVMLYAVLRGRHSDVRQRCGWLALATSVLALTGYVAVYMLTHLELRIPPGHVSRTRVRALPANAGVGRPDDLALSGRAARRQDRLRSCSADRNAKTNCRKRLSVG